MKRLLLGVLLAAPLVTVREASVRAQASPLQPSVNIMLYLAKIGSTAQAVDR